jgi:hypothetical protein
MSFLSATGSRLELSGGSETTVSRNGEDFVKHEFTFTGSVQTLTIESAPKNALAKVKVWGAAGGSQNYQYNSGFGGPGGYGFADVDFSQLQSQTLDVVVGENGDPSERNSCFGHLLPPIDNDSRGGGFGDRLPGGGGLSGLFDGNANSQSNAVIISGAGGGAGGNDDFSRFASASGAGGGPGQDGQDGNNDGWSVNPGPEGRGATTTSGGDRGQDFFKAADGGGSDSSRSFLSVDGSELCGGHADGRGNWTEGGGGGSGFFGGGPGGHSFNGGRWGTAGGGSGFVDTSVATNINAFRGTYESQTSQAVNDPDHFGNISEPTFNNNGHGLVVVLVPQ